MLTHRLPEFVAPYKSEEYVKRLFGKPHLILMACENQEPVGFKLGYERQPDGSFYSWLGGVLPTHRRRGIALQLAEAQEDWAKNEGYLSIRFKTRNRHRGMLHFALSRGFNMIGFEAAQEIGEHRIWLEKAL